MQVAREVRRIRERTGLSQPQFAARYRIGLGRLRDFEQARSEPDLLVRVFYRLIDEDPERAATLVKAVEGSAVE
jgi:putative transcriptional regulator